MWPSPLKSRSAVSVLMPISRNMADHRVYLIASGLGLLGFLLGWLLPTGTFWIIVPVALMGFVVALWSGSDASHVFVLFTLVAMAYWALVVLAGRGVRSLTHR